MATPGFPLPLRNALATLSSDALDADDAHAAIAWLARPDGAPSRPGADRLAAVHLIDAGGTALLEVHRAWDAPIRAHAERALQAAAAHRARGPCTGDDVTRALTHGAALWNERLFFEVHEVLEAVWQRETGDRRQALQGLIQVAVAYHHLAHGNPRGARTLLREGRARLAASPSATLPLVDVARLLADTAPDETALATSGGAAPPSPPALTLSG
jgi:Domain of unknown function (DUF309)